MVLQRLKCPLWRIQELGGYPVDGSEEDVPDSALDEEGYYDPAD